MHYGWPWVSNPHGSPSQEDEGNVIADHLNHPDFWRCAGMALQQRLGYYPSGALGTILLLVLVLVLLGRIPL